MYFFFLLKIKLFFFLYKLYLWELPEKDCVIVVFGNKIDLCNDDEQRPVQYKDGAKLADVYLTLFFLNKIYFHFFIGI